ncbi:MAG: hypothetical protein KAS66_15675 [Candidatus Omnitrophica bacterium]|nr:hypothetical protein [Candidatus Omnitrophota bacterium]
MDLATQLGIVSGAMGVIILLFTAYFLWIPKDNVSKVIRIVQNKEKIQAIKVILLILTVVWLIIAYKLIVQVLS